MSIRAFQEIKTDFDGAQAANKIMLDAMSDFQAGCVTGMWDRTEVARAKAHDALDSFFDKYAAAHKVIGRMTHE